MVRPKAEGKGNFAMRRGKGKVKESGVDEE
jgi:hypothetical protein